MIYFCAVETKGRTLYVSFFVSLPSSLTGYRHLREELDEIFEVRSVLGKVDSPSIYFSFLPPQSSHPVRTSLEKKKVALVEKGGKIEMLAVEPEGDVAA